MSRKAIAMKCPHCGKHGGHNVTTTDPAWYHYDDDHVALFERIAGTDISYRRRTKQCRFCGDSFNTCEMSDQFLHGLIKEVDRLTCYIENRRRFSVSLNPAGCFRLLVAVFGETKANIVIWKRAFTRATSDKILDVLASLPDDDFKYLKARYGLFDGIQDTVPEIASTQEVMEDYITTVLDGALRKLRHPTRIRELASVVTPEFGFPSIDDESESMASDGTSTEMKLTT